MQRLRWEDYKFKKPQITHKLQENKVDFSKYYIIAIHDININDIDYTI